MGTKFAILNLVLASACFAVGASVTPPADELPSAPRPLAEVTRGDIDLSFPGWVVSGVTTKIEVDIDRDKLPQQGCTPIELTCAVGGENQTLVLVEGRGTLKAVFDQKETVTVAIEGFSFERPVRPIPLWFSILPPLLAILLALIFREVLFSLFTGIFLGAAIIGVYQHGWAGVISGFFSVVDTYMIGALNDWGHLAIILFSMTIGAIVAVISRNGGMLGVVQTIARRARTARSGQLATWFLGMAIFFDDYANSLVVGNTMRPITDRLRISREKLSYVVDSTAAPVSAVAFITTWIGVELGYIGDGIKEIGDIEEGVYSVFLGSLQYSFYPLFTLAFILMLIALNRDFGPMRKAEIRARTHGLVSPTAKNQSHAADKPPADHLTAVDGVTPRWINAVIPIGCVVFGTVLGLLYTGSRQCAELLTQASVTLDHESFFYVWANLQHLPSAPATFVAKLGTIVGQSDSYYALLWASLTGLVAAIVLTRVQRIMSLPDTIETAIHGCKTMLGAILILILAWSLALVTQHLHTADFMTQLLSEHVGPWLIPPLTFLLAAMISFATGSSWGTMAILYPLMLPASWHICSSAGFDYGQSMMIFENVVSCVLAGSVLGDHCSPISDTTILSSLACSCNHIEHVRTQMPYALTVGAVAVCLGTLPAAMGLSSWISFPVGLAVLLFIVWKFGKPV